MPKNKERMRSHDFIKRRWLYGLTRERGSNVVEMALVLFVIVLLLIAVADIGRAFHSYVVITNAAREAARFASWRCDEDDQIRTAAIQEATNSGVDLSQDNAHIAIGRIGLPEACHSGDPISVTVAYTLSTFLGRLVGLPELPVRSTTEMVILVDFNPSAP